MSFKYKPAITLCLFLVILDTYVTWSGPFGLKHVVKTPPYSNSKKTQLQSTDFSVSLRLLSKVQWHFTFWVLMMISVQYCLKMLAFTGFSICVSWSPKLRRTTNGVIVVPYSFWRPSTANIFGKLCLWRKVSYFKRWGRLPERIKLHQ